MTQSQAMLIVNIEQLYNMKELFWGSKIALCNMCLIIQSNIVFTLQILARYATFFFKQA